MLSGIHNYFMALEFMIDTLPTGLNMTFPSQSKAMRAE